MQSDRFLTASLSAAPWGAAVTRILSAALRAVEPADAVRRHMQRDTTTLTIGEQTYNLHEYERVFLLGAGKAGAPMARAAADILGEYLTEGVIIVKDESTDEQPDYAPASLDPWPVSLLAASHPLPDNRGVQATQRIVSLLEQTTANDLIVFLVSGGGSALLTLPVPGISLDDIQQLTATLLASGASINEINSLRKHVDIVKGGGIARLASPATLTALVLSDVVGNPLDVIASGPAVPDETTFADAHAVLERYNLLDTAPQAIVAHVQAGQRGEVSETPKAGDPLFAQTQHVLVGSNQQAAAAARHAAQNEGFHTLILTTYAQGEARVIGRFLAAVAREMTTTGGGESAGTPILPRPACLIVGGETTVTLRRQGKGGRNQEIALAAVRDLADSPDVALVTLATDGGDGPTDAAGAVVTSATLERAHALGLNPDAALENHDSYSFFVALGDLLRPGTTHTNVNDLAFLFVLS